jgi:hypothetical protein
LKFTELYPKLNNDLNIGTQNTQILRLGGNGVLLQNGNLAGVNVNTANSFVKTAGTNQQYLMADGTTTAVSAITLNNAGSGVGLINSNTNPNFTIKSLSSIAGSGFLSITGAGTEVLITNPNPISLINITSTDNNLLSVVNTNPTFSITPKYTYMLIFGGNNTNTTAQWLQPGSNRTAIVGATNTAPFQSIVPIASTIAWVNIVRTLTAGQLSLAYSINNGAAVPITVLAIGIATNSTPIATNIAVPAGASLAFSIMSAATSSNCLVSVLLRGT